MIPCSTASRTWDGPTEAVPDLIQPSSRHAWEEMKRDEKAGTCAYSSIYGAVCHAVVSMLLRMLWRAASHAAHVARAPHSPCPPPWADLATNETKTPSEWNNFEKVACGVNDYRRRGEWCVVVKTVTPQFVDGFFFSRATQVWFDPDFR
jgi:hypothetical protein